MQATKLVHRYLDAWNHFDAIGVAAFMSRNGIYFDRLYDEKYSRSALTGYLYGLFAREKHQYQLVGDILLGKSTIAYQYRARDLSSPDAITAEYGAEFLNLRGDKITNIEVYYSERKDHIVHTMNVPESDTARKYEKSGLGPQQAEHYKALLRQLMERDKLFLSPELSLPKLAEAMNCTVNHLSQVINGSMGISFYDFVNQYRVNEAKKLLVLEPVGRGFVLGVATQVGFNSNSAFYAAFRKDTRQTPLEYRRKNLE